MSKEATTIDAAVAMAGVMPLLEPTGNGLGSDAFFLVWTGGKLLKTSWFVGNSLVI